MSDVSSHGPPILCLGHCLGRQARPGHGVGQYGCCLRPPGVLLLKDFRELSLDHAVERELEKSSKHEPQADLRFYRCSQLSEARRYLLDGDVRIGCFGVAGRYPSYVRLIATEGHDQRSSGPFASLLGARSPQASVRRVAWRLKLRDRPEARRPPANRVGGCTLPMHAANPELLPHSGYVILKGDS